jgi:carbonic anhydrase
MSKFVTEELLENDRLYASGTAVHRPEHPGPEAQERLAWDVRRSISAILEHPWIPTEGPDAISVRGFISDVDTGLLDEVTASGPRGSIG